MMRNWLFAFRPDTYEQVKHHGTIGVLKNHRRRFAELSPGDRFVVYLTQKRVFDGHGFVEGSPFEDEEPIFGEGQVYPHRCRVRFQETGAARPSGDELWFLEAFRDLENTEPTNVLFCRGGFVDISDADYDRLRALL